MKAFVTLVGIILIIFGLVTLGYQGFTYTQREKVAQIGSLQVTADTEKSVHIPPILSGCALLVGVALVVIGRKKG